MFKIAFDGANASGKTTLVNKTYKWLDEIGFKATMVHFPNYSSEIGGLIGSLLGGWNSISMLDLDPSLQTVLYGADRALWWASESERYTDHFVIFDRYTTSSLAFNLANLVRAVYKNTGKQEKNPSVDISVYEDLTTIINDTIDEIKSRQMCDSPDSKCCIGKNPYDIVKLIMTSEVRWGVQRPDITIIVNRECTEARRNDIAKRIDECGESDCFESDCVSDFVSEKLYDRLEEIVNGFNITITPYKNIHYVTCGEGNDALDIAFEQVKSIIIDRFPFIKALSAVEIPSTL